MTSQPGQYTSAPGMPTPRAPSQPGQYTSAPGMPGTGWHAPDSSTPDPPGPKKSLPSNGYLGKGNIKHKPQAQWLSNFPAEVVATGTKTLTVILAGDNTELVVSLDIAPVAVGRTVRVSFGEGGACAVTGILSGS